MGFGLSKVVTLEELQTGWTIKCRLSGEVGQESLRQGPWQSWDGDDSEDLRLRQRW